MTLRLFGMAWVVVGTSLIASACSPASDRLGSGAQATVPQDVIDGFVRLSDAICAPKNRPSRLRPATGWLRPPGASRI
ncbi:MAG: hypothetical protein CL476_13965 [Acidobacteria bacterium]|jgi:hypothetical protein|nr:hypothetical protein [Acidobacteriota bacterium]MDP7338142.1 hypothetical protein [Vicinamibacterales bacterium]